MSQDNNITRHKFIGAGANHCTQNTPQKALDLEASQSTSVHVQRPITVHNSSKEHIYMALREMWCCWRRRCYSRRCLRVCDFRSRLQWHRVQPPAAHRPSLLILRQSPENQSALPIQRPCCDRRVYEKMAANVQE